MAGQVQLQKSMTLQPGIRNYAYTIIDTYAILESAIEALKVGGDTANIGSKYSDLQVEGRIVNATTERLPGGQGRAIITTVVYDSTPVWGLEMTEIQKPIKTWHADKGNAKPNLEQINQWEALRAKGDEISYENYKYDGVNVMSGDTLTLAKMIREEGIQYYAVYAPVITCTERLTKAEVEALEEGALKTNNIGKIFTPESIGCAAVFYSTATSFLKTGDRITGALDGTYTRVQTWTGADAWNPNLYGTSSTS